MPYQVARLRLCIAVTTVFPSCNYLLYNLHVENHILNMHVYIQSANDHHSAGYREKTPII